MAEKKYPLYFRLGAKVELTKEELLAVAGGDTSVIVRRVQAENFTAGEWDSYIPGPWIEDNDEIPENIREKLGYEDISVDF